MATKGENEVGLPPLTTARNSAESLSSYRKGDVIFAQGTPADSVYYVRRGGIKMTVTSRQGKEAVIGLLGAKDFFGEGCLIGQPLRPAMATAMTDCVVARIDKTEMVRMLGAQPKFAELFRSHLLRRISRVEEDLVDQLVNSSEKRLARTLLLLASFGQEDSPRSVLININQETLAEMVGTTRSRVSFFMNKFRKLGLIDYNGEIHVNSSLLSAALRE